MANGTDGSVIIDTGLDNSGVEMGAEEVERRVKSLCSAVNKFGADLQKSAAGYASNIGQILSQEYGKGFEGAAQKLRDLADAQIPTDKYKQVTTDAEKAESALAKLEERQEKLRAMGADQSTQAWQKTQADIEETTAKLENYKQVLKDAQAWRAELRSDKARNEALAGGPNAWEEYKSSIKAVDEEIAENVKWIAEAETALSKLYAKQEQLKASGADLGSKQWQSNQYDIEQTRAKLEEFRAEKEKMEANGTAYMSGSETEEYSRLAAEVERLENALNAGATPGHAFMGVMVMLGAAMGKAASAALTLGKRLASIGFDIIANGAKRAISSLKSFASQARKTNLASNTLVKSLTSLKRLLITRIKRMFISAIFNKVKEGIQQLAKYDKEFNRSMSNIKNSATQLSGNIAALVGNIIKVLEPAVTQVIQLLSKAISYINQFFAVLNGKNTYTAAKMGTEDYAKSIDKATKAQKKHNNELYTYDELTRQKEKDKDEDKIEYEKKPVDLPAGVQDWIKRLKEAWMSGDWYGVGRVVADGLNTVMKAVDDWINNVLRPLGTKWAQRIATILNGLVDGVDWPLLGKTLADGLNTLLATVNTFLTTFNFLNLGKGIGAAIKSWFDNVDWSLVGETFANKWNALLHTIEGIVTTPGLWTSIGKAIGRMVKSWFSTIDVMSLAEILISVLNGITAMIRAFLDQDPFAGVPAKIYNAVNRVIHEVDWAALGKSVSDFFMYVLGKIRETVEHIDWHGIGRAIGDFLGSIDWWGLFTQVASIVWTAFSGVLSGLLSTDGGRMFIALVAAINGLSLAFSLAQNVWHAAVQRWIMTGVSPLQSIPSLISGIAPGLGTAISNLTTTLTTGLTSFTVGGVELLHGAAAAFATAALAVGDALLLAYDVKSLNDAASAYRTAQETHNRETETALNNFRKLYQTKGPEIAAEWAKTCYDIDTTGMSMDQAQQALTKKIDTYWDDVPQNMWDGFKAGWNDYFGQNGKGLFALMGDAFTGAVDGIRNMLGIHSPSTVFEGIGRNLVGGFQDGFTSAWSSVQSNVLQAWTNLRTSFSNLKWDNVGHNLVAGLQSGMSGAWSTLTQTVSNLASGLVNRIKSAFGVHSPSTVFAEIGGYLDAGLAKGLADGEGKLLQTASNIATAVTNGMTPDNPEAEVTAEGVISGMQAVISGLSGVAETFKVILDSITAMGGLLTPQIAAGTVVPYKTKVDTNGPSEGDSDGLTPYLLSILSELQALSRIVQNGDNGNGRTVQVFVNGRELFNVMVDENDRAVRMTGASPLTPRM